MKQYIEPFVNRYKGKVHGWDVVNEAFESSGGEYRKESIWQSYIEKAFIYAKKLIQMLYYFIMILILNEIH
tara:strand:- start:1209 stop:1421 length:213 start_codon:yes stop_codon:yes gene_type:complete